MTPARGTPWGDPTDLEVREILRLLSVDIQYFGALKSTFKARPPLMVLTFKTFKAVGGYCVIWGLLSFLSKNLFWRAPRAASMTPQGPELQPFWYLTHISRVDSQSHHFRTRCASPRVVGGSFMVLTHLNEGLIN